MEAPDAAARGRGRGGYTLVETLVTVGLLAVLAAILAPVLFSGGASERLDQADRDLKRVTDATAAFYADVREWPRSLSQLVTPLTGGMQDICGGNYSGGERNSWAGPYLTQAIPAGGLDVGIGTVSNLFTLGSAGGIDLLGIVVNDVEEGDAIALDDSIDADGSSTDGTIRWTTPAVGGQVTLTWTIPITTC